MSLMGQVDLQLLMSYCSRAVDQGEFGIVVRILFFTHSFIL